MRRPFEMITPRGSASTSNWDFWRIISVEQRCARISWRNLGQTRRLVAGKTFCSFAFRVIYQAPDERNYHIFYQLCTQANQSEMKSLALGKRSLLFPRSVHSSLSPGQSVSLHLRRQRDHDQRRERCSAIPRDTRSSGSVGFVDRSVWLPRSRVNRFRHRE